MLSINSERLKTRMQRLAQIGKDPQGGISRIAFSAADFAGREWFKKELLDLGLEVQVDAVGNIMGSLPGSDPEAEEIWVGSHLDTVPQGGMFDGALGVLSGLECIQALMEQGYQNRSTIKVVNFVGEEGGAAGGTFGSRCLSGTIHNPNPQDLAEINLTLTEIEQAKIDYANIKCYLELHVEQGGILDSKQLPIGIVEGIVGIQRYEVEVGGKANHAGTTPMALRDDALQKACIMISRFNQLVTEVGGSLVGTVGKLTVFPGAVNVIPGKVEFTIELRAMEPQPMKTVMEKLCSEFTSPQIKVRNIVDKAGVYLSPQIQKVIEQAINQLGLSYQYMPSGAGHDANSMAKIVETGMIFVPSVNGISHAPEEFTAWQDVEAGANVLLHTLLLLDRGK